MYDKALKIDPTYKEAEFNLGLLMYKYSSTLNLKRSVELDQSEDASPEVSNNQRLEGISHMRNSADGGNFKAYQFLVDNKLMLSGDPGKGPGTSRAPMPPGYASSSYEDKDYPQMASVEN